jgi:hypothetical protein
MHKDMHTSNGVVFVMRLAASMFLARPETSAGIEGTGANHLVQRCPAPTHIATATGSG